MHLDREQVEGQETNDETSSVDVEAAASQIGSELFGEQQAADGEDKGEGQGGSDNGEASTEVVEPPAEVKKGADAEAKPTKGDGTKVEENSEAVQDTGAPKTWTKEALAKWATIDPVVQKEILKREEDMLKGITEYKERADLGTRYDAVVEPYRAILDAEKIDPVQLFTAFSANHYLLSKGTDAQKIGIAANMVEHYKIPLAGLLEFMGAQEELDPEIKALRAEVAQLKTGITQRSTAERDAMQKKIDAEVEAFANDPANIYFDELAADIQQLFEKGLVNNMPEAYEKAIWINPSTRAKETQRLADVKAAEATKAAEDRAREKAAAQGDHLSVKPHQRDGTVVTAGSMDDTLKETMRKIQARAGETD